MQLSFDNSFARELPGDPEPRNQRRQVLGACYSRVRPTPVSAPYLVAYSREMAALLGLTESEVQRREFVEVFSGNRVLPEMDPIAACYGGHQFGNWAGQLGDGRAISLGEVIDVRGGRQELQLKGAGPTPYSRMGDGRAVMRSSVREFLCSEAMHHLSVATTRALCLVGTGEQVERDMFYDGRPRLEPGAIVCRVAPSFVRFGNFELLTAHGDVSTLRRLAEYVVRQHHPHLVPSSEVLDEDVLVRWFEEVCERTARVVVDWMRVGFVHGVLNTDNMSILGLTIDYGPYGWVDDFDPDWTPNTTDAAGRRYRFGHQAPVAGWNLTRLAEALVPLVPTVERLERALEQSFLATLQREQRAMQRQKLGLSGADLANVGDSPEELFDSLQELLRLQETDMTLWYRLLARVDVSAQALEGASDELLCEPLREAFYDAPEASTLQATGHWLRRYGRRVIAEGRSHQQRVTQMNATNPKFVLRNYMAQLAIDDAEGGDFALVGELLETLRHPYDEQPDKARWAEKRPDWARTRPGCSTLSCSS